MRILLDYRPALRRRSGVGGYVHGLATALAGLLTPPDSVTLFSSSWKDRLDRGAVPGTDVIDGRIPVRALNYGWHRLEWPPVEWLAGAADVAHAFHPLMIPTRRAAQVITIHDLDFLEHPERTRAEVRRDYPVLAPPHAARADAIVVISEHTAAAVRSRLNVPAEKIAVCVPGAPDWRPRPAPQPEGPIVFIGTIEPRKNVDGLLRAYERLLARHPQAPKLVVAGASVEGSERLLAPLTRPPLAGRVEYRGYITDQAREDLYRSASMLVVPSFDEGFGIPVVEAMTIGVPVVAANRGALPEAAGGAAILVDPEHDDEIANAMELLLSDRGRAARMIDGGFASARRYSWRASAQRLLEAYRDAIARRARR